MDGIAAKLLRCGIAMFTQNLQTDIAIARKGKFARSRLTVPRTCSHFQPEMIILKYHCVNPTIWAHSECDIAIATIMPGSMPPITVSGSTPSPWSGPFRDHGLNSSLSTENPRNKGFSGSGAPIFECGLADPAPKKWG